MYIFFGGGAILLYLEVRNFKERHDYGSLFFFIGYTIVMLFMTFQMLSTALLLLETHRIRLKDIAYIEIELNPTDLDTYYYDIEAFKIKKFKLNEQQIKTLTQIFHKTIWYWGGNIAGYRGPRLKIVVQTREQQYEYDIRYSCNEHEYALIEYGAILAPGLKGFLMNAGFPEYEGYCEIKRDK